MIDVLAHLDDPRIRDVKAMLQRAAEAGVSHIITSTIDPLSSTSVPSPPKGLSLHFAHGIHPSVVGRAPLTEQIHALKKRLQLTSVVALGECGLDRRRGMPSLDAQREALVAQIDLANALELPVIVHCVHAEEALLGVIAIHPINAGGLVHGFSGSLETAERYIQCGLHISFGGMVTRPSSKKAQRAARGLPLDRMCVESDAPDHPPWTEIYDPSRVSEPSDIFRTASFIEQALKRPGAAQTMTQTARALFRL